MMMKLQSVLINFNPIVQPVLYKDVKTDSCVATPLSNLKINSQIVKFQCGSALHSLNKKN